MSVIGPRPQLVRDMVFMTPEQRRRHTAKPGLSGLAQVNGRNAISWEDKIEWDLKYIEKVSLVEDIKIIFKTVHFLHITAQKSMILYNAEELSLYARRCRTYRKRKQAVKKLQSCMGESIEILEEILWNTIKVFSGYFFETSEGKRFCYSVSGDEILVLKSR